MGASDGVVEHRNGAGLAIAVGPDVVRTIVHIQQGHPIPPASGPTRIDVIKGLALDLDRDRSPVPGEEENLVFLEPIADEFRALIVKAVLYACRERGVCLPVLWYWPDNLPAIAHMSHDSDGGDEALGWSLLRLTQEVDARTTWCIMAGHYQPAFYRAIQDYGSEVALHYDAQTWQTASDDQKPETAHLKWGYEELAGSTEDGHGSSGTAGHLKQEPHAPLAGPAGVLPLVRTRGHHTGAEPRAEHALYQRVSLWGLPPMVSD